MAAGKYDIVIDQGSSFALDLTVQEEGVAKNLSTYSVRSQLRQTITSSTLTATFTGAVLNAAQGKLQISLSPTQTANITPGKYYYDVEIFTSSDAVVTRLLQGTAIVSPEVTR
tara:strand:+ start:227 stop:565 length:339 start_codon:yes stop_codon:yes gene_type:complete